MKDETQAILERIMPLMNRILDTCHQLQGEGAISREVLVAGFMALCGTAELWGVTEKEIIDLVKACCVLTKEYQMELRTGKLVVDRVLN